MLKQVDNPPNRWQAYSYEWLDVPPEAQLQVFEETAKSIISENTSPDIGFRYSVNPYRGCFHACSYCYARPTHQYLDFGAGTDFERKIVVKTNAAKLLEQAFMRDSWKGESLVFSGITDCYQPLESQYEVTRACLEVCVRFGNPVTIITKGALVTRDIDLLQKLATRSSVRVYMTIAAARDEVSKLIEPGAPRTSRRLRALKELSDAGIETGVSVSPIIPGLTDSDIPEILRRSSEQGVRFAFMTMLRLPAEVKDIFIERISAAFPERYGRIARAILEMRNGQLNNSAWGERMSGEGERWKAAKWLFQQTCEELGMNRRELETHQGGFRRPNEQLSLF